MQVPAGLGLGLGLGRVRLRVNVMVRVVVNSGQIVGEHGGTAFPFRFWRGNAVPLAYTTAVGGRGKRPSVIR